MRILHITQGYYPAIGGTELLIQRISEELVSQFGDDVTVFTTNCYNGEAFFTPSLPRMPVGEEIINGVKIHRFPVQSNLSRFFRKIQAPIYRFHVPGNQYLRAYASGPIIPGLRKAITTHQSDILVASSFPLLHMFVTVKASKQTNKPVVLFGGLHPDDKWGFDRPMIYKAISKATHYIAYTDYEAKFVARHNVPKNHITVIGVGVDPERFDTITTSKAKKELNLSGYPVVGFIGQLGGAKGVDTLVKSMPDVWSKVPEARLLIAGAKTLFSNHLEYLISKFDLKDQKKIILKYNFPEEEKPLLFAALDVFVYPSGFESFGIAFLEAWASHKPVIGCNRGAIPWVVDDGTDGVLVPYQDHKQLANAIIRLLSHPTYANELAKSGYKKVLSQYTWEKVARKFRKVYLEAIQEHTNK